MDKTFDFFPKIPIVSNITKEVIQGMLSWDEAGRMSWEELNDHQIFQLRAAQILDLKLEGSGDNPLYKSIERHLMRLSNKSSQGGMSLDLEDQKMKETEFLN